MEAQWQMVEVLEKIVRALPCRLFCEEGGCGDVSLAFLRPRSDPERRRHVALTYFHHFRIGAADYLDLAADFEIARFGVDDPQIANKVYAEKAAGRSGSGFVGSVARARAILDGCLAQMDATGSRVAVLLTSDVPAYLIARLLGEHKQFLRQGAREFGPADLGESDIALLESMYPETPEALADRPEDLLYVVLRMPEPSGDLFTIDVNHVHSLTTRSGFAEEADAGPTEFPIKIPVPAGGEEALPSANQSVLARDRGESDRAAELERQAVASWERTFGERSQKLAECLNALARALQDRGHHAEAVPLCRRVVAIAAEGTADDAARRGAPGWLRHVWRWALGRPREDVAPKTNWLAVGLNNLGLSLTELGQLGEAEEHLTRSVNADPASAAPRYWLARLYRQRRGPGDEYREAENWERYLELGPTTEVRRLEATTRLAELRRLDQGQR